MPMCKKDKTRSARALFVKKGNIWKKIDMMSGITLSSLNTIEWFIAFDGRNLGKLKTIDPTTEKIDFFSKNYERDKILLFERPETLPEIENKERLFEGWCEPPILRPLVLVNKPFYKDPERWRPFRPDVEYKAKLLPEMKNAIGDKAYKCGYSGESTTVPWDFQIYDLILYKSYRSESGKVLISIGLAAY